MHSVIKTVFIPTIAAALLLCQPVWGQKQTEVAQFDYFKYEGKDERFKTGIDHKKQYYNPIVAGYYPDPSVCRKGDTYYLVNSSFGFFPGVPIFKSKDLVNWKQIGHVLDRPSQLSLNEKQGISSGIFAPAISYNPTNDTFYMITTDIGGIGNFYVTSKDPEKGWSEPVLLPEVRNIDPSFLFDDDGKAYIVHNDEPENGPDWNQQRSIRIHEFDVATGKTIGKSKEILRGGARPEDRPIWIEGPHLYKINGYYYLMCAEGGTDSGHSEVVFRSKSPWGPYVAAKTNPILTQRDLAPNRENIVACTGHADLIQTPKGDWWAVFLGTRPYTNNFVFNTGRETFLLPVTWENDFPVILKKGEPVPTIVSKKDLKPGTQPLTGNFTYNENFEKDKLDHSWIFIRTPKQDFYKVNNGKLAITPLAISTEETQSPSAILRRQQHTNFSAETQVEYTAKSENDFAGLVLFQNEKYQFLFGKTIIDGKESIVLYRIEGKKEVLASKPLDGIKPNTPVKLKVEGKGGAGDFLYSLDGKTWQTLAGGADMTNLSTQKAQGFVGTCIGLYATKKN
ncbi:glycoside hydrolase family 43 protein [Desertivirga brevis]|uniref:glycoside hydrolase family 43 protein n=1 Tax=Desertivirga brevis TaxID=2810310 RepID=UPI001A95BBF6|nr:glycoside hydrolase family 43 protein [Pedobacter sp. SYSU D00873]